MFRRLAESFEDTNPASYLQSQQVYQATLPNLIVSPTSGSTGLAGFGQGIQTVDPMGKIYQPDVIRFPDQIFRSEVSPALQEKANQCASSSIDELIAIKNPSLDIGCGWLYSPPTRESPHPQLSKGFLGTPEGPIKGLNPPAYKQWFFDLQLAKKQMMLDKCKALKACSDVDSEVFKGMCGYCTDRNQGVPIDSVGRPLYGDHPLGSCSTESIIRSSDRCPPPPEESGPLLMRDRVCEPVGGRLSAECIRRQVIAGGCDEKGALALALADPSSPADYVGSLRNSDSVKIYNRVAQPPLNLDVFGQGRATTDTVLREVRQLAANRSAADTSALGASARELCLRKGALERYDLCSELSDGTMPPYDLKCLQSLFLKMGGQPAGTMYPQQGIRSLYDSMSPLSSVKQYLQQLASKMNSEDYSVQREAMIQFLGITPERSVQRAPYSQGVEVFWFAPVTGDPRKVAGFLRRTIERDIVQFQAGPSRVPQIGGGGYGCMVQMTDVRMTRDTEFRYRLTVDDGFWIAANQPASSDSVLFQQPYKDEPGLYTHANVGIGNPVQSQACTLYRQSTPNITRLYWSDAGGGSHAFQIQILSCSQGGVAPDTSQYSLTCESRAPFLTYEVSPVSGQWGELRNPGLFGQFLGVKGLELRTRPEERERVPGKKPFVRLQNTHSLIDMYNIAYQSWATATFAIRLVSMPVKESLITFVVGSDGKGKANSVSLELRPINGETSALFIGRDFEGQPQWIQSSFTFSLNEWYLIVVGNRGTEITISVDSFPHLKETGGRLPSPVVLVSNKRLYQDNGLWHPAPGQAYDPCTVMLGTNGFLGKAGWPAMSATAFQYDLAWVHFFAQTLTEEDVKREVLANWIYTSYPSGYNQYTLKDELLR